MGTRLAALLAGRMPKPMPISIENRQEPTTAHQGTAGGGKFGISAAMPIGQRKTQDACR